MIKDPYNNTLKSEKTKPIYYVILPETKKFDSPSGKHTRPLHSCEENLDKTKNITGS